MEQLEDQITSTLNYKYMQELTVLKKELQDNKLVDMMQTKYEIGNI